MEMIPRIPCSPNTRHRKDCAGCAASQHPAPWWYRLLSHLFPNRCREIPEANNPDRLVLRQYAVKSRDWYLQQFASGEDPRYMHSHPYKLMIAIGLWGSYTEHRIAGAPRRRRAPYFYVMDGGHVHHVQNPSPGHTSLFLGFGRQEDDSPGDKKYFGAPRHVDRVADRLEDSFKAPVTRFRTWRVHIKKKVARI